MLKLLAFIVWNQSEWGWDPGISLFPCDSLFSSRIVLSLLHDRKCSASAASQEDVNHRHWDRTSFSPLKPVCGAEDRAQQSSLLTKQTWWDHFWETSSILLSMDETLETLWHEHTSWAGPEPLSMAPFLKATQPHVSFWEKANTFLEKYMQKMNMFPIFPLWIKAVSLLYLNKKKPRCLPLLPSRLPQLKSALDTLFSFIWKQTSDREG